MKRYFSFSFLLISILLLSGAGCSEKVPAGFPKLFPCTLTIIQENKPLAGADVLLYSKDNSCKWMVGGQTDESGNVVLHTHGKYAGVPKGSWVVTVIREVNSDPAAAQKMEQADDAAAPEIGKNKIISVVDLKYKDRSTSPLEITIEGKTSKTLDVGKPVRIEIGAIGDA